MSVVNSLISAAESVAKSREAAKAKAAKDYRAVLERDAEGKSHKDDAELLGACLDVLELAPADAEADAAALAEHAKCKAKVLDADQRDNLVEAIRTAYDAIRAAEHRHQEEIDLLLVAANSSSARFRIATTDHDRAETEMDALRKRHTRVFDTVPSPAPALEKPSAYTNLGPQLASSHQPPVLLHGPKPVNVSLAGGVVAMAN